MNILEIQQKTQAGIQSKIDNLWDSLVNHIQLEADRGNYETCYLCDNRFIGNEVAERLKSLGFSAYNAEHKVFISWIGKRRVPLP